MFQVGATGINQATDTNHRNTLKEFMYVTVDVPAA
jgi:hypothetical protein